MQEIWKSIPGYEGHYEASSLGRIRSLCRTIRHGYYGTVTIKERILKPHKVKTGYLHVDLRIDGVAKTLWVHRIVALTFHGPSDMTVDHINGSPDCNLPENLEYVTQEENVWRSAKRHNSRGLHIGVAFVKGKYRATRRGITLGTFDTPDEAKNAFLLNERQMRDRRTKSSLLPNHIYRLRNKFYVAKSINGKRFIFGYYATLCEAKDRLDYLKKEWEKAL